jgi:hypothetical protein
MVATPAAQQNNGIAYYSFPSSAGGTTSLGNFGTSSADSPRQSEYTFYVGGVDAASLSSNMGPSQSLGVPQFDIFSPPTEVSLTGGVLAVGDATGMP